MGAGRVESRRYVPHLTLTRCGPEVSASVVDAFLTENKSLFLPGWTVGKFGLYSSSLVNDVPVYRRESEFSLQIT
jgi:2'-5' RNA ligase